MTQIMNYDLLELNNVTIGCTESIQCGQKIERTTEIRKRKRKSSRSGRQRNRRSRLFSQLEPNETWTFQATTRYNTPVAHRMPRLVSMAFQCWCHGFIASWWWADAVICRDSLSAHRPVHIHTASTDIRFRFRQYVCGSVKFRSTTQLPMTYSPQGFMSTDPNSSQSIVNLPRNTRNLAYLNRQNTKDLILSVPHFFWLWQNESTKAFSAILVQPALLIFYIRALWHSVLSVWPWTLWSVTIWHQWAWKG